MKRLILFSFLISLVLSCSNLDRDNDMDEVNCEVDIPIEATEGKGDLSGAGGQIRYVTFGDSVSNEGGGSNQYYIESGGYVSQSGGGAHLVYIKNNGTLDITGGGGSIQIIREEGAILNNTLNGGGLIDISTCDSIVFGKTYLDSLDILVNCEVGIGSQNLNDTHDNIQFVDEGDIVISNEGEKNTYYISQGGEVNQMGGSRHLMYVKNGGVLNISGTGGSNTIYSEPGAIINNTLSGERTNYSRVCEAIVFNIEPLEPCEIDIPSEAITGSGELSGGSNIRLVEDGDMVSNSGSGGNMYFIEAGGSATQSGGGGHMVYVKRNGTINILGSSSMTIYYEEGAIINKINTGSVGLKRCSEVIFN